jgi:hypothetical protein
MLSYIFIVVEAGYVNDKHIESYLRDHPTSHCHRQQLYLINHRGEFTHNLPHTWRYH